MNAFFISYDPFAMESRVCMIKDDMQIQITVCSDLNELVQEIVDLAYKNNIYDIKLQAPPFFVEEVKNQVSNYEMRNYSINKITIEGIK